MNWAIIDSNGNVITVIVWDGIQPYTPPAGTTCVQDPNNPPQVGIGWTYVNGVFSAPVVNE